MYTRRKYIHLYIHLGLLSLTHYQSVQIDVGINHQRVGNKVIVHPLLFLIELLRLVAAEYFT